MASLSLPWCRVKLSPVTRSLGEEAHPHLATTSCQGVVESESNFLGLAKRISVREQRLMEVIVHVWTDSYVVRIVSVHDALALR